MDIRIDTDASKFKVRACGIIENEGKYLIIRMSHNPFFCCAGGHIELGEDSESAVVREMEEESGIKTTVKNPLAIMENFYKGIKGEDFHEISFYYLLNPVNLGDKAKDFNITENDHGYIFDHEFRWVTPEELKEISFKPEPIKQMLINGDENFKLIINKD